ncbi:MAG: helix-turn-helix domain-containing protein [Candidatus Izemoplasma sp.]
MLSLKNIMTITNLSERTVRRHIENGTLVGTKVGGVWRFSEEQLESFYGTKDAIKKIRKEATQQIVDFINMPNPDKLNARACIMIDLRVEEAVIEEIKSLVMSECNKAIGTMTMKFLNEQDNYRFILIGTLEFIETVTTKIYQIVS